jgi:hypothetical protein
MPTTEFFISHIIDKIPPSKKSFEHWPLHMTVVPPFILSADIDESAVFESIAQNGQKLGAIELRYGTLKPGFIPIEIGNEAMFGEYNNIPVVEILDPSGELHKLHSLLIKDLGRIGCNFLNFNPLWNGRYYSPHVAIRGGKKPSLPFFCTTLTLCKKEEDEKSIVKTINLNV